GEGGRGSRPGAPAGHPRRLRRRAVRLDGRPPRPARHGCRPAGRSRLRRGALPRAARAPMHAGLPPAAACPGLALELPGCLSRGCARSLVAKRFLLSRRHAGAEDVHALPSRPDRWATARPPSGRPRAPGPRGRWRYEVSMRTWLLAIIAVAVVSAA